MKLSIIFEFIIRIVNFFLGKSEKKQSDIIRDEKKLIDERRLAEDNALKEAIQNGDYEMVSRIIEKRKLYPNL